MMATWHNASSSSSIGSSTSDPGISCYQRFRLTQPRVIDLGTFGSRAVVLKPPPNPQTENFGSFVNAQASGEFDCYGYAEERLRRVFAPDDDDALSLESRSQGRPHSVESPLAQFVACMW